MNNKDTDLTFLKLDRPTAKQESLQNLRMESISRNAFVSTENSGFFFLAAV